MSDQEKKIINIPVKSLFTKNTRMSIHWFAIRAYDGYVDEYQKINNVWFHHNNRPKGVSK